MGETERLEREVESEEKLYPHHATTDFIGQSKRSMQDVKEHIVGFAVKYSCVPFQTLSSTLTPCIDCLFPRALSYPPFFFFVF